MRILFASVLKDFSGFGHASRNFLKLLEASDFEVSARSITYDRLDAGQHPDYGDKLEKALKGPISDIDLFVQMTTCNQEAEPAPGVCNALYTFIESDRLHPAWVQKANTFDFLMVPSVANAQAFARSGVTKPILVTPPSCDITDYTTPYEPFDIPNVENRTVFYNICQLSSKKGIDVLLRSYYAAFADMPDDVLLVLKTYVNMGDRSKDKEIISQFINRVWQGCRIPVEKRPPVLPIIQTLSDDEIHGLHMRGDAYVCTSRAEGWCTLPGAIIQTGDGLKKIEEVEVGDKVLTHSGNFQSVSDTFERKYNDDIFHIKTYYGNCLSITPNHQVLTYGGWKRSDDITVDDYIAINKKQDRVTKDVKIDICDYINTIEEDNNLYYVNSNQYKKGFKGRSVRLNRFIPIDNIFAKLLGLYIAEGSNGGSTAKFSVNIKEVEGFLEEIINPFVDGTLLSCSTYSYERNRSSIEISSEALCKMFDSVCGKRAENKHLPLGYHNWNDQLLIELIRGYWLGDGTIGITAKYKEIRFSTVSKRLALEVKHVLSILGFITSIHHRVKKVDQDEYVVKVSKDQLTKFTSMFDIEFADSRKKHVPPKYLANDNYFFVKVRDIRREPYDGLVYNIAVPGDESYTIDTLIVHNCLPVFDALAHGKSVITHRGPSLADFVQDEFALCYQGLPGLFYDVGHADPSLFTGVETCFEPSAAQVAHLMRTFHLLKKGNDEGTLSEESQKEWQKVLDKRKAAMIVGEKFHYGAVSERVCEQLKSAFESWKETGEVVFNKEAEGVVVG